MTTPTPSTIDILHLRQASGSGGGADTVIYNNLSRRDKSSLAQAVVYLSRRPHETTALTDRIRALGIECFDIPGGRLYDRQQASAVADIITERGVKIIHCHDDRSRIMGLMLARRFPHLRLVATIHGWIIKSFKSWLYANIDQWALRRFHMVIAVSGSMAEVAQGLGLSNIHVVPNSIDAELWHKASRDQTRFCIGYVGRFSPEKGPLDFVSVAAKVISEAPNAKFVMAGEGPQREEAAGLVSRLGLADSFTFAGQVAAENLPNFYQQLDALLLCSYSEGLPMTLLEAGATAVPVVASNVGGVAEIVTNAENGFLVEPGDIDTMAERLLELCKDPDMRHGMGDLGRSVVEQNFSLLKNVITVEELYRTVLSQ